MVDTLTVKQRSLLMARVRGKDTRPELFVRKMVHDFGYRFRLHRRDLPGCPDLVFPRLKKVIFVNGCFWHGHLNCRAARVPKSRISYWRSKIERNAERDRLVRRDLARAGWTILTIWECEIRNIDRLTGRTLAFLRKPTRSPRLRSDRLSPR